MLGLLLAACNSSQKTIVSENTATKEVIADPTVYANTITETELREHLYTYASDAYEGRETGTPGQKKATAYLKAEYEKLDIPAAPDNGDYLQKVPLEIAKSPNGTMTLNGNTYDLGSNFVSFNSLTSSFDEMVYAVYGIDDENYSNFDKLDVKGKLVLIKDGEPKNADGTYTISGTNEPSKWSQDSMNRFQVLNEKGAAAVFMFSPSLYPRVLAYYNRAKNNNSGRMSIKSDKVGSFNAVINEEIIKQILPQIKEDNVSKTLPVKVALNIKSTATEVLSENVVAIIEGSEKPDEYLVISSHLDHIGISNNGEINNGADDDGSGTVALLEIAEAFKKAKDAGNGPKRSVVFLHVTGEEKGLLGSQYYTDVDPIFPLKQTVANLNIDMIGRIDPKREGDRNYIYLIGSDKLSIELHELSESINKLYANLELDYTYNDENDPNRFYYRSDHYNFAKNNIPIIFYFNGTHDDYHRPSDTPDKINYDLLENRSRLIFYTAWEIANRKEKIKVDNLLD